MTWIGTRCDGAECVRTSILSHVKTKEVKKDMITLCLCVVDFVDKNKIIIKCDNEI